MSVKVIGKADIQPFYIGLAGPPPIINQVVIILLWSQRCKDVGYVMYIEDPKAGSGNVR